MRKDLLKGLSYCMSGVFVETGVVLWFLVLFVLLDK